MRLLTRIALTTIAVGGSATVGVLALDATERRTAAERTLAALTFRVLTAPSARARCEADPRAWTDRPGHDGPRDHRDHRPPPGEPPSAPNGSPPRRGPHEHGHPRVEAPRFRPLPADASPDVVAASLDDGARPFALPVSANTWTARPDGLLSSSIVIAARMPWSDGPCALVVTTGSTTPGFLGAVLPEGPLWMAPLLAVALTSLIALVPVVRRLERLTAAVRSGPIAELRAPPVEGADEVATLAHAFARAANEVRAQLAAREDRERALREFLANTTHDVMVPLTVLMQHLATLRAEAPSAAVREAMAEADYIAALLQNLSAAARLDHGTPTLDRAPVDLGELVGRVVARHRSLAEKRDVELTSGVPEAPLFAFADLTLLEQALSNLVYNAIHYNEPQGHVAVVLDREADRFHLAVLDDGPGIPEAELSRLAERGFRGDAARRRGAAGHGLGLHITHTVAQLHGYPLTFAPRDGGGLQVSLHGEATARSPSAQAGR